MIASTLILLVGSLVVGPDDVATKPPAFDKFLVVPLRIHVLTDPDLALANSTITDAALLKSVGTVNAIWAKAGIAFGLESITRGPAARRERFKAIVELNGGEVDPAVFALLLPPTGRTAEGLQAFVFRDLPLNGAYLGEDAVIVMERAQLRQVAGGSADPIGRVIARGLGQALGLPGVAEPTALLGSGTNGVALTGAEVDHARTVARTVTGSSPVADLRKAADAAESKGDKARARLLFSWLAEIPGAPADLKRRAGPSGK